MTRIEELCNEHYPKNCGNCPMLEFCKYNIPPNISWAEYIKIKEE